MDQDTFLQTYGPLANDIAGHTGLHPAVVLGTIAQETGMGDHVLSNNIYGISPTRNGQQYVEQYPSVQHATQAYIDLINRRYKGVTAQPTPEGQAQALVSAGYNTADPTYAGKVGSLAKRFQTAGIPGAPKIDYEKELLGAPPAANSIPAPAQTAPSGQTIDYEKELLGQPPPPVTPSPAAASVAPAAPTFYPGLQPWMNPISPDEQKGFAAGASQGVRNLGITANQALSWAGQNIPGAGAFGKFADKRLGTMIPQRDAFNAQYGDNDAAQLGLAAGQTAATLPVMGAVNPLIAGGARAIAAGADALSPAVGSAVRGVSNFIGGGGGAATAAGPSSLLPQIASRGTAGAVQGAEAALINSGGSNDPLGKQALGGAEVGGAFGAVAPIAGRVVNALSGATSNLPPEIAGIAQLARDRYGIQFTAPQLGMSKPLAYANNALKMVPGSGAGAEDAMVQGQFNRALSQTFGEDANKITPQVLSNARTRIGGELNRIEGPNNSPLVNFDQHMVDRLADIEARASQSLVAPEMAVIKKQLDGVMNNIQPGDTLGGTTYGNLIHKGSPLDSAVNSNNSNIAHFAGEIKEALRDGLYRSLSPQDAAAYQLARTQYKNLMTVRPLTMRADTLGGALPSTGDISPAALRAAVNKSYGEGISEAAPGTVAINDLAKIGQYLKPPPSSGTAERGGMLAAGAKTAQILGAIAAGNYAGIPAAMAGVTAGVVGGRMASSYLRSPMLANRMIDSSLNPLLYSQPSPYLQYVPGIAGALAGPRVNALSSRRE